MSADEVRLPLTAVAHPERSFARSVQRLRLARGWTLTRLAAESGVGVATISRIEAELKSCSLPSAWLIAEAFEVSLDAMIRGEIP